MQSGLFIRRYSITHPSLPVHATNTPRKMIVECLQATGVDYRASERVRIDDDRMQRECSSALRSEGLGTFQAKWHQNPESSTYFGLRPANITPNNAVTKRMSAEVSTRLG